MSNNNKEATNSGSRTLPPSKSKSEEEPVVVEKSGGEKNTEVEEVDAVQQKKQQHEADSEEEAKKKIISTSSRNGTQSRPSPAEIENTLRQLPPPSDFPLIKAVASRNCNLVKEFLSGMKSIGRQEEKEEEEVTTSKEEQKGDEKEQWEGKDRREREAVMPKEMNKKGDGKELQGGCTTLSKLERRVVSVRDDFGNTSLHLATIQGSMEIFELLTPYFLCALEDEKVMEAVLHGEEPTMTTTTKSKNVVHRPLLVTATNNKGETPLHTSVSGANVDMVREVVKTMMRSIDRKEEEEGTPSDNLSRHPILLQDSRFGFSALHLACQFSMVEIVQVLKVQLLFVSGNDYTHTHDNNTDEEGKMKESKEKEKTSGEKKRGEELWAKLLALRDHEGRTALEIAQVRDDSGEIVGLLSN